MGRLTQGHFDDLFFNKIKQACLHVLDQLNEANEIDQAFDLCPSVSRRNRVILSFLRDADSVRSTSAASSSSTSPTLPTRLPSGSTPPEREPSLGTDSVASLSAQRRRRAREMQYVRDPNDSHEDSDSQATISPSYFSRAHLDPASARNPSMSQPDYTFEQFAEHLDPSDKLLKRSLEIIIKETARQALARKRMPNFDHAAASSSSSHDPAATLRSAIASSHADPPAPVSRLRDDTGFARRMSRALNLDPASTSRAANSTANSLDHTYQLLRSLRPAAQPLNGSTSANPSTGARRSTWTDFLARSDSVRDRHTSSPHANRESEARRSADADPDVSLTRTTSLSRRNAVRGLSLNNSDSSSLRSARSSLSLRRPLDSLGPSTNLEQVRNATEEDNDAVEEDVVETSIEIGSAPRASERSAAAPATSDSSLLPPPERPRAGRSGSFTFVTTPAAVLRSRQRSESRSQPGPRTDDGNEDEDEDEVDARDERDPEAEEYIDLDLDLGMAGEGAFDFDLFDFLRSESRRLARRQHDDDDQDDPDASSPGLRRRRRVREGDDEGAHSDGASPTGIRVFVSGSGASTPAEARQATFEAYAQRARLLERRRRMERQRQESEHEAAAEGVGGNGSAETSPESRRRRRGRNIGADSSLDAESGPDRRNSLPFPRTSER